MEMELDKDDESDVIMLSIKDLFYIKDKLHSRARSKYEFKLRKNFKR